LERNRKEKIPGGPIKCRRIERREQIPTAKPFRKKKVDNGPEETHKVTGEVGKFFKNISKDYRKKWQSTLA